MKNLILLIVLNAIIIVSCGGNAETSAVEPFNDTLSIKRHFNIIQNHEKSPTLDIIINMDPLIGNNEEASKKMSKEIMTAAFGLNGKTMREAALMYVDILKEKFHEREKEYEEYKYLKIEDEGESNIKKYFDRFNKEYRIKGEVKKSINGWVNYFLEKNLNTDFETRLLNFDPETGELITLDNIFTGNYRNKLQDLMFENYFKYSGAPYSSAREVPVSDNFVLNNNTIDFWYDTPKCICIKIKYTELKELLRFTPAYNFAEEEKFCSQNKSLNNFDTIDFDEHQEDEEGFYPKNNEIDYLGNNVFVTDFEDNIIYRKNSIYIDERHRVDTTYLNSPTQKLCIAIELPKAKNDTATEKIDRYIAKQLLNRENASLMDASIHVRDSIVSGIDFEYYYSEGILKGSWLVVNSFNEEYRYKGWCFSENDSIYRYATHVYAQNDGSGYCCGVWGDRYEVYNFNSKTGELIELEDIFKEGFRKELTKVAENILLDKIDGDKKIYSKEDADKLLDQFVIEDSCLKIIYSYSYRYFGHPNNILIEIPYEKIKHLLR